MKICFKPRRFGPRLRERIARYNAILAEISSQGYTATLRQLFYQMVARGWLANDKSQYDNVLCKNVVAARMAGEIDWDLIEDRLREIIIPPKWENIGELLSAAAAQYRLDRQNGQPVRIEIWCEKDAASQILGPTAREYGIPLLVGRGQFSMSCVKQAVDRWEENEDDDRPIRILYFGDFDPCGVFSIEESIRERVAIMSKRPDIEFIRVAVPESDRIRRKLPPNYTPIKKKDPCRAEYVARHGEQTWELEAMKPSAIQKLLEKALERWMDMDVYLDVLNQEEVGRERLAAIARREGRRK